jgi:hypothetical protein
MIHGRFYHMHRNGVKMVSRQYRNDILIDTVTVEYYNENNQFSTRADATLEGTDRWELDCYQDQDKHAGTNVWGLASADEMCMLFISYYPYKPDVPHAACGYSPQPQDPNGCHAGSNLLSQTVVTDLERVFDTPASEYVCETVAPTLTAGPTTSPTKSPSDVTTPVVIVLQISLTGMSMEDVTSDTLADLKTIASNLAGVDEEFVDVRILEAGSGRRLQSVQSFLSLPARSLLEAGSTVQATGYLMYPLLLPLPSLLLSSAWFYFRLKIKT